MALTKDAALKFATDALREVGLDEEARWLEQPQHVRALLKDPPGDRNGECPGSLEYDDATGDVRGYSCGGSPHHPHTRACPVAAAWRALGDPRGAEDIENAHEEALREGRRRSGMMVSRNGLFGVDPATYELWRGNVVPTMHVTGIDHENRTITVSQPILKVSRNELARRFPPTPRLDGRRR